MGSDGQLGLVPSNISILNLDFQVIIQQAVESMQPPMEMD
jgi:hypothetical protein